MPACLSNGLSPCSVCIAVSINVQVCKFVQMLSVGFKDWSYSGQISVAGALDRERQDSYVLKIRSTSGNQYCVTKVGIEITDVNDNAPRFLNQSYQFTAPCGSPNAFVGAVTVTDKFRNLISFPYNGSVVLVCE